MKRDDWRLEDYAVHASYVSALSGVVMQDLSPAPGEVILDLGCGDGTLAAVMQKCGCRVIGVDSSESMVAAARNRGIDARKCDAQDMMEFAGEFDAVFSNAAMHWMPRQDDVIHHVHASLKPGGRFVAELGGKGNIAHVRTSLACALSEIGIDFASRDPWTFPNAAAQRARLEAAGFRVIKCALRRRPTVIPTDMKGWMTTFCSGILSDLPSECRHAVIGRTVELCRPVLRDPHGKWVLDFVRLNLVAIKPGKIVASA